MSECGIVTIARWRVMVLLRSEHTSGAVRASMSGLWSTSMVAAWSRIARDGRLGIALVPLSGGDLTLPDRRARRGSQREVLRVHDGRGAGAWSRSRPSTLAPSAPIGPRMKKWIRSTCAGVDGWPAAVFSRLSRHSITRTARRRCAHRRR